LAGRWVLWGIWAVFQLTILEAGAHDLLAGLEGVGGESRGSVESPLVPVLRSDKSDILFNGIALLLLSISLPTTGAGFCVGVPTPGPQWRVGSLKNGAKLRCEVPLWWVLLYSSCNLLFLYELSSHMLIAHLLLSLASLGYALIGGFDQWLHSRLVGLAVTTALVLVSGRNGIFKLTLAPDSLLGAPNVGVVAAWAKANCALVLCLWLYALASPALMRCVGLRSPAGSRRMSTGGASDIV